MRCTICQRFLPKAARKGTKFCGTNCRSRAYRLRQPQADASTNRPSGGIAAPLRPKATRSRKQAHNPVTIPAVLEHLQQVRARAGLPPLRIEPMLAYQANLDALLTEHMATQRIVTTHVTDAGQVTHGTTAGLNDPGATQVGIGVSLTERGDSLVVILLGRQVRDASAPSVGGIRPPAPAMPSTPHSVAQQVNLQPHATVTAQGGNLRILKHGMKLKLWHGFPEDQPTPTPPSDESETVETAATRPSDKVEPET